MFASISSAVLIGAQGYPVRVEAHVGKGLPGFSIGGLPDESVREARDRTRAAILSIGLQLPTIKVTLNLAPSHCTRHTHTAVCTYHVGGSCFLFSNYIVLHNFFADCGGLSLLRMLF